MSKRVEGRVSTVSFKKFKSGRNKPQFLKYKDFTSDKFRHQVPITE